MRRCGRCETRNQTKIPKEKAHDEESVVVATRVSVTELDGLAVPTVERARHAVPLLILNN